MLSLLSCLTVLLFRVKSCYWDFQRLERVMATSSFWLWMHLAVFPSHLAWFCPRLCSTFDLVAAACILSSDLDRFFLRVSHTLDTLESSQTEQSALFVTCILLHASFVTVKGTISFMRTRTGSWLAFSSCPLSWFSCPCWLNAHSAMSSGILSSSTRGFGLFRVPFTSRILAPLHFSSSGSVLMVLALTTAPNVPMRASFVLKRMPNLIPSPNLSSLPLSRLFVLTGK